MQTKNDGPSGLPTVDIIIPTYDNATLLEQCVNSLRMNNYECPVNIIVVNNGQVKLEAQFKHVDNLKIINAEENLGWEGGLIEGLKHSTAKYVVFANDDIYVPQSSKQWLKNLIRDMETYPRIGACGPTSNVVMGKQNIWFMTNAYRFLVTYLIGFCVVIRREALDKAGGVQIMEHGGDDLDLSIRLRKAGYFLTVSREEFVYHHGFQTGAKLHGGPEKPNGWNSREMMENVNMELIRKHGFVEWRNTISGHLLDSVIEDFYKDNQEEKEAIKKWVKGETVLELGCSDEKTVDHAIGVDRTPYGKIGEHVGDRKSVADVVCDVSQKMPFPDEYADTVIGRHVLEHCVDMTETLKEWYRCVKKGGRLIVAVPDHTAIDGIGINPEHLHAFTPESFKNFLAALNYKVVGEERGYNKIGFTAIVEKPL